MDDKIVKRYYGKTISSIELNEDVLRMKFNDSTEFELSFDQCCCEERFMSTDDDLNYYIGSKFTGAALQNLHIEEETNDAYHEVAFLNISTSLCVFTIDSHNKHNGYYSGFCLRIKGEQEKYPEYIDDLDWEESEDWYERIYSCIRFLSRWKRI